MPMRTRLLLLLLGAPLAVMLLLSFQSIRHDAQIRKAGLETRLITSAELLAPAVGNALSQEASGLLHDLAQRLLNIDEVRSLRIHDRQGRTWLHLGQQQPNVAPPSTADTRLLDADDHWYLSVPIPEQARQGAPTELWLTLAVDTTSLALGTYRQLAITALTGLVTGLLLFLLAYLASRRLTRPLHDAQQALLRLNAGDYRHRMSSRGPKEAKQLAAGINALAEHLSHAHDDMQRHIEQTTHDLQESMETIEIKNIELDMAHRRALEANRIKTEFLANMSHEIRTPLNGIIGFCQLLSRSPLDTRQREWLEHVHKASDSLLSLINDILDFSKIEAGKLEFEAVDLDMVALVDDVLGLQAPQAHQKRLHLLALVYDDVPAQVQGDPLRIKQVLTNLVHNAIKFTEHGEVIVRVTVEDFLAGQVTLKISVSDTGIGLDPECHDRLFKAFSQASVSDTRQYGGTGLGLMICRQLVEQMGGEIGVESQPGQGTTFAFTLPLLARSLEERPPELSLPGTPITLHETHAPTRRALMHLLKRWGARVTLLDASSSADAESPVLLLAGLQSEDLEGAALADWQERLDAMLCPAVLLINASAFDVPDLHLPHGGEILTRPLSRQVLASTLETLLKGRSHQAPHPLPTSQRTSSRVLVVDDTASNRLLVKELLTDLGLTALLAASGEEALALAQSEPLDLVLMDIRLPGMDGVATTHALRKLGGAWRHCPIIAVTAHALEEERRRLLQEGLDDVLIKPLDSQELARLLSQHLNMPLTPSTSTPDTLSGEFEEVVQEGELPIVDMALGTTLAGGHESLARETLDRLLDSLEDSDAALRQAWRDNDAEAFLDAIHALNGACRYCGVPQLALIAETLETRLRTRGLAKVETLLIELFDAMARLRAWQATNQFSSTTKAHANSSSSLNDK
ncbi:histidine kinase [Litchfieldella qijiaojingensis]|uniref:histidine kinase n=1 Tax=Litchfieldella qijiaojingensis TaxID=980347 RepID=A0ABQ2YG69_9GAMM|nr:hybrid sensor histidine kinase/response regulator [Halomonas qijiaojingensis]GGX81076.1 histidine kinase [Halomonas qijiaojingensis]